MRITRSGGWVVLNADDPRILAMRRLSRARPFAFGLDPDAPGLREAQTEGGRAATVLDGDLVVLTRGRVDRLLPVLDVPVTLAGLASFNVANALAAAAAGLAIGLPARGGAGRACAASARPRPEPGPDEHPRPGRPGGDRRHGPQRGQPARPARGGRGACACPAAGCWPWLGTAGDRSDELIRSLGELAARGADRVVIGEKQPLPARPRRPPS